MKSKHSNVAKGMSNYANEDFIKVLSNRALIVPIMPFVKSSQYINCAQVGMDDVQAFRIFTKTMK